VVVAAADLALEDGHHVHFSRDAGENYMARWMNRQPVGSPSWRQVHVDTGANSGYASTCIARRRE
jgi:hypothetical protein